MNIAEEMRRNVGDRWAEVDSFAHRWLVFPALAVRLGARVGVPIVGGLNATDARVGLMRSLAFAPAAKVAQADDDFIGERQFNTMYLSAIRQAYPRAEWRITPPGACPEDWPRRGWMDQCAFAFVGGCPVALVAPFRKWS